MAEQGLISAPGLSGGRGAFIDHLRERGGAAARAVGGFQDRDFEIAGLALKLRFAGEALQPALTPALAHARAARVARPDLVVDVWDSESTGVSLPSPAWSTDDYRELGAIRGWFDDEVQAVFQLGSNALTLMEPQRGTALYWVRDARDFPFFERAAPFRTMLNLWLSRKGLLLAHAAAVGCADGCLLLTGRSGTGKSSTALACLSSYLRLLSDDYCVLSRTDTTIAHALYSSAKVDGDAVSRLGLARSAIANPDRDPADKGVIYLQDHFPDKLLPRAPVRAIVVPVITGESATSLERASGSVALATMAPSTLLQLPGARPEALSRLADVVRSVPCYRLAAGTDPREVSQALESVLGR